jgi:ubiquinone/menaquinone biosynthesis C-methylase UbiE
MKTRSYEAELLDAEDIAQDLLFQNLAELNVVNHYLGGHAITFTGLQKLMPAAANSAKPLHIVDIGCGSGDTLLQIAKKAAKKGQNVRLTGVDIKPDVISYAQQHCKDFQHIQFLQADYRTIATAVGSKPDIFICSLFCHHLTDEELVALFEFMNQNSKIGFIINDLQRNYVAYYGIKLLTQLFNGSTLVKNDAPLSVKRGFHKSELENILAKAGIAKATYELTWEWAFRYLLVVKSTNKGIA